MHFSRRAIMANRVSIIQLPRTPNNSACRLGQKGQASGSLVAHPLSIHRREKQPISSLLEIRTASDSPALIVAREKTTNPWPQTVPLVIKSRQAIVEPFLSAKLIVGN